MTPNAPRQEFAGADRRPFCFEGFAILRLAAFIAAAALGVSGCAATPPSRTQRTVGYTRSIAAVRLDPGTALADLNGYRASHGLSPVRLDPSLTAMAQRQAEAMAAANQVSHEVAGSFSARLTAAGVATREAGENLGAGYRSVAEAMDGWRGSPAHDANLLLPRATRFGIALAKDPSTDYGVYWAMVIAADP